MKICMLTSSYPKYPGETTAPFIEEIAAGLVRLGHEIHVVAPFHRDIRRPQIDRGVHLHFFRYSPHDALNVWGYAESLKADVNLKGRVLLAAPLALAAGTAALWRELARQQFDLVHGHWVIPNGTPAALVAAARGLPLVISLHGSDVFLSEKAPPLSWTAAATFRAAAAFTACSSDLRDRALLLGAPAERATVIPYGVDVQSFQPDPQAAQAVRSRLGIAPDAPLILALGRMVYKKGFSFLLDAMPHILQRHPGTVLVLAGYGDLREALEQQARTLGIAGQVRFPGQLAREETAQAIAAADVYVVPSVRDQRGNVDGLPNVLLEGMAAGRAIVASRLAGIPEVITDGEHGLLVPEQAPDALAGAIIHLLAHPHDAARLGQNARRRVLNELTWDATARRFAMVYEQALARHAAS